MARQPRPEVGDPHHGGVPNRAPGHLIGRNAAQVGLEHPQCAAVGDHHDVPCGLVIDGRELVDELGRPAVQVADGLAARRAGVRIGHPSGVKAGRGRPDRRRGKALEHPERPLAEPGVGVHGQAEHRGEGGGGLPRAAQVAGVDRPDRAVAELPGGVRGLAEAATCKLREVVVPLRQARDVPGRLAVPDQPEGGSRTRFRGVARVVHARQLGQSVLKNDENVNDFRQL